MRSLYVLLVFSALLIPIAVIPTVYRFGPGFEAAFLPVTTAEITSARIVGSMLFFSFSGDKLRKCPLESLPFHWSYDHALEAAAVHTAGGEVYNPMTVIASGTFKDFGEFHVMIPEVAYGLPVVEFGGVMFHRCHDLWTIPHEFSVKLILDKDGTGKLALNQRGD